MKIVKGISLSPRLNNCLRSCLRSGLRPYLSACLLVLGHSAYAQDSEIVTLGSTITGNQEQPTVLYIVPWKQTEDNSILAQPLESKFSDVFDHVEREEHQREVEFLETLVLEDE
ncbi:MAG: hypothetical protein ACI93R_003082 [Flavobacteriales bacterium]|jgi:hypothetical protein